MSLMINGKYAKQRLEQEKRFSSHFRFFHFLGFSLTTGKTIPHMNERVTRKSLQIRGFKFPKNLVASQPQTR